MCLATVEVYNPRANTWRSCTPMSQRREGAVAGVVGGRLVVAGGVCDGDSHISRGLHRDRVDPAPAYAARSLVRATACVLNGRLYVMGGMGSNKLQVLEMTEENGFSWSCKADLPAERYGAASVIHDGQLWLLGGRIEDQELGYVETASVLIYDMNGGWVTGPPLPRGITDCRAICTMRRRNLHLRNCQ